MLALRAIRRNLMRSFLTILGIVIGVGAVITMVTLGNGATRSVQDQISSMGSNLLMMRPGKRMGPPEGGAQLQVGRRRGDPRPGRRPRSRGAHRRQERDRGAYGPELVHLRHREHQRVLSRRATGAWPRGRAFNEAEERGGKSVCVIGETVRRELFGSRNPLGD